MWLLHQRAQITQSQVSCICMYLLHSLITHSVFRSKLCKDVTVPWTPQNTNVNVGGVLVRQKMCISGWGRRQENVWDKYDHNTPYTYLKSPKSDLKYEVVMDSQSYEYATLKPLNCVNREIDMQCELFINKDFIL